MTTRTEHMKACSMEGSHTPLPWATLSLTALAMGQYLLSINTTGLGYEADKVHEVWRLLSCHLVHWNGNHAFWSIGVFLLLGWLCEQHRPKACRAMLLSAMIAIPLGLWIFTPDLQHYGGLSGLDSALFVFYCADYLQEKRTVREYGWCTLATLLLLGFCGKIGYELLTGNTLFAEAGSALSPVPLAHAIGGIVGIGIAYCTKGKLTCKKP